MTYTPPTEDDMGFMGQILTANVLASQSASNAVTENLQNRLDDAHLLIVQMWTELRDANKIVDSMRISYILDRYYDEAADIKARLDRDGIKGS